MGITIKVKHKKRKPKKLPFRGKVPANVDPVVGLHEERRDQLNNALRNRKADPNNAINANYANHTSAELAALRWSGIRHNKILDMIEIWVMGECKGSVMGNNGDPSPSDLATLHERIFATVGTILTQEDT